MNCFLQFFVLIKIVNRTEQDDKVMYFAFEDKDINKGQNKRGDIWASISALHRLRSVRQVGVDVGQPSKGRDPMSQCLSSVPHPPHPLPEGQAVLPPPAGGRGQGDIHTLPISHPSQLFRAGSDKISHKMEKKVYLCNPCLIFNFSVSPPGASTLTKSLLEMLTTMSI